MSTRTVRLDETSEKVLEELVKTTGLSISGVLKRGLHALREQQKSQEGRSAYEIYEELDLGPGGYAIAPAADSRRGVREALRRKHRR